MTILEKKCESIRKEIEKYTKAIERYNGILEKKIAKCNALNCNWTREEFFAHRDVDMTKEQYGAYFDKEISEDHLGEARGRLANACKRYEKATAEREAAAEKTARAEEISAKESAWIEAMKQKAEEYKKWLEEFKADCAKDGVTIEAANGNYVKGLTKNGAAFVLYLNNGFTERSLHSYTLRINGEALFTSGLFSTCYSYIVNR